METDFLSSGNSVFWSELFFYLWKALSKFGENSFQRKSLILLVNNWLSVYWKLFFFFFHIEKQHIFFIIFLVVYTLQFQIIGYRVGGGGVLIKGGARQINETSINERAPSKREGDVWKLFSVKSGNPLSLIMCLPNNYL